MRLHNGRGGVLISACVAAILLVAVTAPSAMADQEIVLYDGQLQGISLASWGSGSCQEIPDDSYQTPVAGQLKPNCLRVDTQGLFVGGRLDLANAIALEPFFRNPDGGYVELYVKVFEGGGGTRVAPTGREPIVVEEKTDLSPELVAYLEQLKAGNLPGGGGRGGGGEGEGDEEAEPEEEEQGRDEGEEEQQDQEEEQGREEEGGQQDEEGGGGSAPAKAVELKTQIDAVRVIVVTDKGTMCSGTMAVNRGEADPDGWIRVVMPFAEAAAVGDIASAQMTKLALTADAKDFFYVGRVRMLQEDRPLIAEAGNHMTVNVRQPVTFTAAPQPQGEGAVRYAWDCSQSDELREDELGRTVQHTFEYPGYYIVTLVVSDLGGKRVPKRDTLSVVVR